MGILVILWLAVVLAGLGWPLVVRLGGRGGLGNGERVMMAFVIGAMAVGIGVEVVGRVRLDMTAMAWLAVTATALALPGLRRMPWRSWAGAISAQSRADAWTRLLWLAVLAVGTSSMLQGLAPPNDYDSLMYHLAIPQLDVERGRIEAPWGHGLVHAFFPQMLGNLYRLTLVLVGSGPVQMVHGLFGLAAAGVSASLALRMGYGRAAALLAALMFLSIRAVVWQMASAEVDVASGTLLGLALIACLQWREAASPGRAALFGLMLAGGLWVKYHGFAVGVAFVPVVLADLVRRRVTLGQTVLAGAVALIAFAPHMARDILYTGNPLFPLFNPLFTGGPAFFKDYQDILGIGRMPWHVLVTPLTIFLLPTHYYDGMVMGAPYLLALIPAAWLGRGRIRHWRVPAVVAVLFYVEWFYLLSQQVRFLAAIWPVMAAFAAVGAVSAWEATARIRAARRALMIVLGGLALAQAGFVGIYTVLRLPPALGLMSATDYHTKTPTLTGAYYTTCGYIRDRLGSGEHYLSLITPHSFYCPQMGMIQQYRDGEERSWLEGRSLAPLTNAEALAEFERLDFRYVIVMMQHEWRAGLFSATEVVPIDFANSYRFGHPVAAAIKGLQPLITDSKAAVFDGREVRDNLRRLVAGGGS